MRAQHPPPARLASRWRSRWSQQAEEEVAAARDALVALEGGDEEARNAAQIRVDIAEAAYQKEHAEAVEAAAAAEKEQQEAVEAADKATKKKKKKEEKKKAAEEAQRRAAAAACKTPRKAKTTKPNEPCPCGSGKKFKKCCGLCKN